MTGIKPKEKEYDGYDIIETLKMNGMDKAKAKEFYDLISSDTKINFSFGAATFRDAEDEWGSHTLVVWKPGSRKNLFRIEHLKYSMRYWGNKPENKEAYDAIRREYRYRDY